MSVRLRGVSVRLRGASVRLRGVSMRLRGVNVSVRLRGPALSQKCCVVPSMTHVCGLTPQLWEFVFLNLER